MKNTMKRTAYYPVPRGTPPAKRPDLVLPIVTDAQAKDKAFVQAVRQRAYGLTQRYGLTPAMWRPLLIRVYQDFDGCFTDKNGTEVMIDTTLLEPDEDTLFKGTKKQVTRANDAIRERLETMLCLPCENPRLYKSESRALFQLVASILSVLTDHDCMFFTMKWNAANDNMPPELR